MVAVTPNILHLPHNCKVSLKGQVYSLARVLWSNGFSFNIMSLWTIQEARKNTVWSMWINEAIHMCKNTSSQMSQCSIAKSTIFTCLTWHTKFIYAVNDVNFPRGTLVTLVQNAMIWENWHKYSILFMKCKKVYRVTLIYVLEKSQTPFFLESQDYKNLFMK